MRDRTGVLLIAAAVLALDQITKLMVSAWIPFQIRIDLIDNFLASRFRRPWKRCDHRNGHAVPQRLAEASVTHS